MFVKRMLAVLVLGVALLGCGGDKSVPVQTPPPTQRLQAALNEIAQTGELGSATEHIAMLIDELKESDPAKAATLEADFQTLQSAPGPAQVRNQAKTMAEKL